MLGFWVSSIGLLIGVSGEGTAGDPVQHDRHVPVLRPGRDLVPTRARAVVRFAAVGLTDAFRLGDERVPETS